MKHNEEFSDQLYYFYEPYETHLFSRVEVTPKWDTEENGQRCRPEGALVSEHSLPALACLDQEPFAVSAAAIGALRRQVFVGTMCRAHVKRTKRIVPMRYGYESASWLMFRGTQNIATLTDAGRDRGQYEWEFGPS